MDLEWILFLNVSGKYVGHQHRAERKDPQTTLDSIYNNEYSSFSSPKKISIYFPP